MFITEKAVEIDAFIVSQSGEDADKEMTPSMVKFTFKKDIDCIRVLASETKEVTWSPQHFLSVLVEDEDDEKICSKQIILSKALRARVAVLLYDV